MQAPENPLGSGIGARPLLGREERRAQRRHVLRARSLLINARS